MKIVTKDPSQDPSLDLGFTVGNYETYGGKLYATTGIGDNLAADIALVGSDQGEGWGDNLTLGVETGLTDDYGVRSTWLWTPSEATSVRASVDYTKTETTVGLSRRPTARFADAPQRAGSSGRYLRRPLEHREQRGNRSSGCRAQDQPLVRCRRLREHHRIPGHGYRYRVRSGQHAASARECAHLLPHRPVQPGAATAVERLRSPGLDRRRLLPGPRFRLRAGLERPGACDGLR